MLSLKGWVLIGGAGGSWVGGGDGCAGVGGGGWLRNSAAAGATAASFHPAKSRWVPMRGNFSQIKTPTRNLHLICLNNYI